MEQELGENREGPRAGSRNEQDDTGESRLEVPAPARQEQERKPGYGGNCEKHRGEKTASNTLMPVVR